ncbi:hypothetical protein CC86DRAFT_409487 [Ophiobolus disseminans]|uniref:Uncharacterized protein n=1 Tax=Ophiobolus disseminans TaxID=1469910 RepID=A0A6A6ZS23_9PLEO|nr:hypothetical protein CC86DRAFT_409487 [Ophiobolus disseminans]
MAFKYGRSAIRRTLDIIEPSDSDDIYSISDEEPTQQDLNNQRLTQAINYLNEEGGEDSPAAFIDRVNRIDEALLQKLPQQSHDFDQKLYRRARAMVLDVQRDYQDAAEEESMQMDSEDYLPEYYAPTAADDALYRGDTPPPPPPPTPTPAAGRPPSRALASRRQGSDDNVQREREFIYGGPKNEPENWHKDFPASLPFPETLLMVHWESLKIDYDLSQSKKDSGVVDTYISFDHPLLKPYMSLPQYDSGSRFKLPLVSSEDQLAVSNMWSLEKAVNAFNKSDQSEGLTKDYAPRISLGKFQLNDNQQHHRVVVQNQIRRALAASPLKPKVSSSNATRTPNYASSSITPGAAALAKSTTGKSPERTGPAVRRITTQVKKSLDVQPVAERATPTSKPTPALSKTATHVQIPKRGRGRPRKEPLPDADTNHNAETPLPQTLGKRKPSAGSQPYTPAKSSVKKVLRDAKRQKTVSPKKVGFVDPTALEDDLEGPRYSASAIQTPPRVVKVTKASQAGTQAKKKRGKKATEESASEDEYVSRVKRQRKDSGLGVQGLRKGTTRSGTKFGI